MAPSSRNKASRGQAQPAKQPNVFRVTKATKLNVQPQTNKQKLHANEEIICPKEQAQVQQSSRKRRHDVFEFDRENEEVATRPLKALKKARSALSSTAPVSIDRAQQTTLQLQTPPPSSPEHESLPTILQELISLHKTFAQALAVHYAHNPSRNAVSLSELLPAMTRLWKRTTVCQQDIQRMLAIWDVDLKGREVKAELDHKNGPFRLLITGIGVGSDVRIEYAWTDTGSFIENQLHQKFERLVERWHTVAKKNEGDFIFEKFADLPLLKCSTGVQTQARKEKISSIKAQILSKPAQATSTAHSQSLDFSRLDISDPSDPKPNPKETALKSRTLSLFDRLRAKQLANTSSGSPPTSADILRRRSLHRMPEIIDVLRLKQARKVSSQFRADIHGSPSKTFAMMMKVSFSLDALVQEIRDSGKTNVAADEVKECISILGREVPDTWCSVFTSGDVKCVTLQGEGWRKEEIKEWCDREISRIEGK